MSTEQNEPTTHYGDDGHSAGSFAAPVEASENGGREPAPGGSSNSGRRRRRRRKNKGSATPAIAPPSQDAGGDTGSPLPGAVPIAAAPPQQNSQIPQQNGQQFPQNGPAFSAGGKRKKHRKRGGGDASQQPGSGSAQNRPREARPHGAWKARNADGPDGNREGARGGFGSGEHFSDNFGNGGGHRKGKFGRRTGFVGPMDHSYRAVNGNVADGSPSTMDYRNANGNIGGRGEYRDVEPAASPVRDDAPTRIVCFIEDLFVVAKMQEAARKLGVKVQFAKAEKETLAAITEAPEAERPSLIVFDLNNGAAKPLTVIPKLKAKLKRGTSIIGFLQQIQGDLKLKAIEAGCDSVMPKAAFSQNVPNLLRRHGLAEEEEEMLGV